MDPGPQQSAPGRPGAVSTFFVYKAGLFAVCFWGWLGVLAVRGGPVSGWHIVAAAGAVTTSLVGVILGARIALARNAATNQDRLMRAVVEISWYSFEPASNSRQGHDSTDGDADVIPLSQDARPRPRR